MTDRPNRAVEDKREAAAKRPAIPMEVLGQTGGRVQKHGRSLNYIADTRVLGTSRRFGIFYARVLDFQGGIYDDTGGLVDR